MAGIGGRTIEEAKRNLSYREALQWFAYRNKYGGLGPACTHRLLATIAAQISNLSGGEATPYDFLVMDHPEQDEPDAGIGDIMNILCMSAN